MLRGLDTGPGGTPRRGRPREVEVTERVLFGLVANRALAPSSKLAAADWINHDVHIDGLPETTDDACYRAMDWLHDVRDQLEVGVFRQVANLLNLEVDLLFFDTTSTYFELEDPDEPVARDDRGHVLCPTTPVRRTAPARRTGRRNSGADRVGFRTYGKSKDSRDDLPQIVIGMAVTRDGIPVRVWCWPGNTNDSRADPPGQGRHAGLDPVEDRVGRRPRVLLRDTTAATCARAITPTSSGRSCARTPRRSRPRCRGRAATPPSRRTCGSRR